MTTDRTTALPVVHVNDGGAHDRAMAWSEGYEEGYKAGLERAEAVVEAARALVDELSGEGDAHPLADYYRQQAIARLLAALDSAEKSDDH